MIRDIISPIDQSVYVQRPLADPQQVETTLNAAQAAQQKWANTPLSERADLCRLMVEEFTKQESEIIPELAWQIGRPIKFGGGEVKGFAQRAHHMIDIAPQALADIAAPPQQGFNRFIRKRPLGVVLVIAAWNYPYLIAVNSIIPALMAGNAVILKHASQTMLAAERIAQAGIAAGMPEGLFGYLHLSHQDTDAVMRDARIAHVNFTGSVAAGRHIKANLRDRFIGLGLELGGKDPAYVRADADLPDAIENLVDGAYFNSGQSCCGIERIYVAQEVYDDFVDGFVAQAKTYRLGNPLEAETIIGPMVSVQAAEAARQQIAQAIAAGADSLLPMEGEGAYLSAQILVNVTHNMSLMREESFAPLVGIMPVESDDQAIALMNDSDYGLTASLWTQDIDCAEQIGMQIETGTVFMNRCDYLDPALAWTGVKDTGHGVTLSPLGYDHLTRAQSFHLKQG